MDSAGRGYVPGRQDDGHARPPRDVIFTVGAGDITDMDQVLLTALEAHRESCE